MQSTSQFYQSSATGTVLLIAALSAPLTTTPASALNIATPASVDVKADSQTPGDLIEVRAIAAGAAIGFVTAATAAAWAGAPPAAGMCWYYTDPSRTQGFWDYCQ